jgi:hypothetical protein
MSAKITEKERQLLTALYGARGLKNMTSFELLSAYPHTFEGRTSQGIHQTAASLVRKGLVEKGRRAGLVTYRIRLEAGVRALAYEAADHA